MPDLKSETAELSFADIASWLRERRDSCLRIAELKPLGPERDGWLRDAEYFIGAASIIESVLSNAEADRNWNLGLAGFAAGAGDHG